MASSEALPKGAAGEMLPRSAAGEAPRIPDAEAERSSGVPAQQTEPDSVVDPPATPRRLTGAISHGREVWAGTTSKAGRPCASCCEPASARCTRC